MRNRRLVNNFMSSIRCTNLVYCPIDNNLENNRYIQNHDHNSDHLQNLYFKTITLIRLRFLINTVGTSAIQISVKIICVHMFPSLISINYLAIITSKLQIKEIGITEYTIIWSIVMKRRPARPPPKQQTSSWKDSSFVKLTVWDRNKQEIKPDAKLNIKRKDAINILLKN